MKNCPESHKISYAHAGALEKVCPTQQAIDDLIAHIRNCDGCKNVLVYVRSTEKTFRAHSEDFFTALEDVTPDPLPPSSPSETTPS